MAEEFRRTPTHIPHSIGGCMNGIPVDLSFRGIIYHLDDTTSDLFSLPIDAAFSSCTPSTAYQSSVEQDSHPKDYNNKP